MGIGVDIKEVLADVGTKFNIVRDVGGISGEYLDYEPNQQVTKPFIREYFLEATVSYDSAVIGGDVVQFDSEGVHYLVMNRTPERFENEITSYGCVLYKCNLSGEIHRFSGEGWDSQTYEHDSIWETIKTDRHALLTERLFGTNLDQDEELGQLGLEADLLYIPSVAGIQPLDRFVASSGEYYKVTTVETRKFDGVDMCKLEEDTRL